MPILSSWTLDGKKSIQTSIALNCDGDTLSEILQNDDGQDFIAYVEDIYGHHDFYREGDELGYCVSDISIDGFVILLQEWYTKLEELGLITH